MKQHMVDKPKNYQYLVEQLVTRRKQLFLSQEELSHRLNISERLVNNWECGFKQPSSHMLFKWMAVLDGKIRFASTPLDARDIIRHFPISGKRKSAYELIDFICSTHGRLCFETPKV